MVTKSPVATTGKLKVPPVAKESPAAAQPKANNVVEAPTSSLVPPPPVVQDEPADESDDAANGEQGGWGGDDDLDLADSVEEDAGVASTPVAKVEVDESPLKETETSPAETKAPTKDINPNEEMALESPSESAPTLVNEEEATNTSVDATEQEELSKGEPETRAVSDQEPVHEHVDEVAETQGATSEPSIESVGVDATSETAVESDNVAESSPETPEPAKEDTTPKSLSTKAFVEKEPEAEISTITPATPVVEEETSVVAEPPVTETKATEAPKEEAEKNTTRAAKEATSSNVAESLPPPVAAVPDDVRESFSQQMQRVEANHQEEQRQVEQEHTRQIEELQASFNHDACEATRRELEERLLAKVKEREERMGEVVRVNEGYQLKLDVLQREVDGTQQLLEAKSTDMGKASDEHSKYLKTLETTVREKEQEAWKSKEEVRRLKAALEESSTALVALKEQHATLRARVKDVAGELKERRVECRQLGSTVVELKDQNDRLQDSVDNLQSQLSRQDRSGSDKDEEMEQLRAKLVDTAADLEKAHVATEAQVLSGGKSLGDYKRKAQSSLSLANSRTAAAIQAKEEAELEARAARATADSAMDRAVKAEIASKGALAEAKVYVKEMEDEKSTAVRHLEHKGADLKRVEGELALTEEQLQQSLSAKESASIDLKEALEKFKAQEANALKLRDDLLGSEGRVKSLLGDVGTLREALERAEAAAASIQPPPDKEQTDTNTPSLVANETEEAVRRAGEDETIRMLQQELHDANEAIEDLKEALKNAVETTESPSENVGLAASERSADEATNGGTSATPLFFAMEKQAELNTARNEINRLANLLGSVQSEKMEAHEAMEDMRTKMEAAEARLQRFEKLGVTSNGVGNSANGSVAKAYHDMEDEASKTTGSLNIEYLKNIMLSYLNAKSLAERKALIPVIGAVLCLTADEQKAAMTNAEDGASLGGVGASLFESFSGRLTSK